jgi:hypothetical protein
MISPKSDEETIETSVRMIEHQLSGETTGNRTSKRQAEMRGQRCDSFPSETEGSGESERKSRKVSIEAILPVSAPADRSEA